MDQADIPVFQPHLGSDTLDAVRDAFEVGWIGMGAATRQFEETLADRLGSDRRVVATMTGTAALHQALRLAGVTAGHEVILPSFNFIADMQAVLWCGATPVFCDIEEPALGVDPEQVVELITPRTRAIMPLHFAGVPCDLDAVMTIAADHDLRVIEDATHALGSTWRGRPIGGFGDLACLSFDPVKTITCLDGGAVVCGSDEDVTTLQRGRLLGIDRDTVERYRNARAWDYDVASVGFRDHMTSINASIGLSQLARLDEFVENRRRDCRAYDEAFGGLDWLTTPAADWESVGPFIYTVRVGGARRAAFQEHLHAHGVATGIHFLPCHRKTLCRDMPCGPMSVTDRVADEIVTLPLWSLMPAATLERVIDAVRSFGTGQRPVARPAVPARNARNMGIANGAPSSPPDAAPLLTPEQCRRFEEDGLLVLRSFYDLEQDLEPIQRDIHGIIGLVIDSAGVPIEQAPFSPATFDSGYRELIAHDRSLGARVYDAVKQVIGFNRLIGDRRHERIFRELRRTDLPGVAAGGAGIRIDNPNEERFRANWHQEYPAQFRSLDGIVYWTPLVPVDRRLGPVRFCRGSHRAGLVPVHASDPSSPGKTGAYALTLDRESERVSAHEQIAPETEPGDLVLVDFLTLHASGENGSNRSRWSMQFRYFNFRERTGVGHGWSGSFAAGVDIKSVHPELVID